MSKRERLPETTDVSTLAVALAEGNVGAATVLGHILKVGRSTVEVLKTLEDMNIRGSQLWVAWKDICRHDTDILIDKILSRDSTLVDKINKICYHPQLNRDVYKERAVTSGWNPS